jgi:hypothetical protein
MTKKEAGKARAWRESLGLSRQQLANLTGYSRLSIHWFEQGITPPGRGKGKDRTINKEVWQRYRMACGSVHVQVLSGREFRWGE